MSEIPNPGTEEARDRDCACPVLDNAHGQGYMGQEGVFVYTVGCPLHDERGGSMKSVSEKVYDALELNGCAMGAAELSVDTLLALNAVHNGIEELLREGRVRKVVDGPQILWTVA